MVNNTIESNRSEAELASEAENAKRQLEAAEFANSKEAESTQVSGIKFDSGPSSEHAEKVQGIISSNPETKPPIVETESGLTHQDHEELAKDPVAWINKTISNPKLFDPNKAMEGLSEALDQSK